MRFFKKKKTDSRNSLIDQWATQISAFGHHLYFLKDGTPESDKEIDELITGLHEIGWRLRKLKR